RQMDGYVLTVAKSGIKFKESSGPERISMRGASRGRGNVSPEERGGIRMETFVRELESGILAEMVGKWITYPGMGLIPVHVPLDDRTGLKGLYEIPPLNTREVRTP